MKPKKPKRQAGPVERLLLTAKEVGASLHDGWRFIAMWHGQAYIRDVEDGLDEAIAEARRRGL